MTPITFYLIALVPLIPLLRFLYNLFFAPLRSVPGPFAARLSSLWYFRRVHAGRFEQDNISLHRKYASSIVRLSPNSYSFSSPSAISVIYGHGHEFNKTRFYDAFMAPHTEGIFSMKDNKQHGQLRKKFQSMYAMSSMVNYEGFADECIKIFTQRLSELADRGGEIDMAWWLQCYAADTIGMVTFSKRFGFLDAGEDIGGLGRAMHKNLTYAALVGTYYNFHTVIYNTIAKLSQLGILAEAGRATLVNFANSRKAERRQAMEKVTDEEAGEGVDEDSDKPMDFLDKFMRAYLSPSTSFTESDINAGLTANIVAGSDTTASSLSAILYFLLRNPKTLAKLRSEISSKAISSPPTFAESKQLPYLQAVFMEALRLHPAVGLPLMRIVPAQGAEIDGKWFPGGTEVGVNSWVIHYSTEIWGEDAAIFRPERWIEAKELDEKDGGRRHAEMNKMWMPFGLGSRTCIGKNVSILEINKLVPEIVQNFDFELSPELKTEEWKTKNHWFVIPQNFRVTVKERRGMNEHVDADLST